MNIAGNHLHQLLIVSLTPYFLEKEVFWFQENLTQILQSQKTQQFFQDNTIFVKAKEKQDFGGLLRKLDEMGYEKVFSVTSPGEFSKQGGLIEIFPVNMPHAVRLDFLGNTLENITPLGITVKDQQKSRDILQKKITSQKLFSDLKNLKPGDFLVHLDHGVAKFSGMQTISGQEYYVLEYAQQDKLFIPFELERKLSRYVGFADPAVSRLGSSLWQKTKGKIKEDVEKLAKDLLALYANKEMVKRPPYEIDRQLEEDLRSGFPYQETPDQLQALEDIKKDMGQEKPMDRIVCGDVGFGKTEIALRAAFFAGINGRQTALICPTTILASQHYQYFKKRFEPIGLRVAALSRLQKPAQEKTVIKAVAEGNIDVLIGTHRILSGDIVFKQLQLLIIDDEQRFGVKQKEKLRGKNPSLDLLSLSATPIPRTIYLALSSFKNISLMQTPPEGRSAIKTHILPASQPTMKEAILFELGRDGQVYVLHNRVASMEKVKLSLKKLVPKARIATIHGRMQETEIMRVMEHFAAKQYDILVATTIIENGIDLPNVNTIIIEDASRLGLAQAHQIRGRVGRSHLQSFAYFFHPTKMPALAKERLRALGQASQLGAGYHIAIKDLELRGAGNILGREQSGSINKIGLNLYCQMLAEAVEKMRQ